MGYTIQLRERAGLLGGRYWQAVVRDNGRLVAKVRASSQAKAARLADRAISAHRTSTR